MVMPALAQDDGGDMMQQRREEGWHYDRELQRWYRPEETGTEPADDERMADTSIPGWEYDREARLWYDTERPGWAWDPMTGRWYHEDRPGQSYDMRTGRWYPSTGPGTYYDSQQGRWYHDPEVAQMRGEGRETVRYFDEEAGRWREEPASWRYYDEQGRYRGRYYDQQGTPIDPRTMGAQPQMGGQMGEQMSRRMGQQMRGDELVGEMREIEDGTVTFAATPATLTPGEATIAVSVDGAQADQAEVRGYLYRPTEAQTGANVRFSSTGGMMYANVDIPAAGRWELALRIVRPDYEDELVYYVLDVQEQ
jgi:hypothetical protein